MKNYLKTLLALSSKKNFIVFFLGLLAVAELNAQQVPQYTQYLFNDFAINPAIAGKNKWWDCKSNNRYQWSGITDAPRTYVLSLNGPMKNKKMGLGGTLYTDIVGPTRRIGLSGSYAYHMKLNETYKLSLGLSAGILQWAVDGSKITLHDPGDAVMSNAYQSVIVPDFAAGAYLYSKRLFVSVSVPQLYEAKLKFFDYQTNVQSKLKAHLYLMGGYRFQLNEDFELEPSAMIKYVKPAPLKVDVAVRCIYQDQVWLALAFRTHDALTAMVGYKYKNWLTIGYSYDFTITPLRQYTTGTHEIMFGIQFMQKDNKPSQPITE
ncbi:MAG: type IX secretion system membrane protein PorP/SprF [Bacteroidia bacterium]|nr:type IX secretion system membrane protein PorP/SprF [Bacteroidia bacterium]